MTQRVAGCGEGQQFVALAARQHVDQGCDCFSESQRGGKVCLVLVTVLLLELLANV